MHFSNKKGNAHYKTRSNSTPENGSTKPYNAKPNFLALLSHIFNFAQYLFYETKWGSCHLAPSLDRQFAGRLTKSYASKSRNESLYGFIQGVIILLIKDPLADCQELNYATPNLA
jgi:hypothetical protein